jgi:CRP/FNR family transcriptional regulator
LKGVAWDDLLGGDGERAHIGAGDRVFRAGNAPPIAIIRAGFVRVFIPTDSSRQVTIGYARPGDLVGLGPALGGADNWNAEAIVQTTVELLAVEKVRAAASQNPALAWLIAEHIASWATQAVRTAVDDISQTMRARVARHLRELALPTPDGRAVVHISHQRLADAVGTVREVISRQLGALRADGLIDTQTGMIVLLDDERLEGIAASRKSL